VLALAVLMATQFPGCSSDGKTSCADLAARIATLEAPPPSADPSWDSILAMAERTEQHDSLRAQQAERRCT
jgi:hypothetical protein